MKSKLNTDDDLFVQKLLRIVSDMDTRRHGVRNPVDYVDDKLLDEISSNQDAAWTLFEEYVAKVKPLKPRDMNAFTKYIELMVCAGRLGLADDHHVASYIAAEYMEVEPITAYNNWLVASSHDYDRAGFSKAGVLSEEQSKHLNNIVQQGRDGRYHLIDGYNYARACEELGITEQRLRTQLAKLDIGIDSFEKGHEEKHAAYMKCVEQDGNGFYALKSGISAKDAAAITGYSYSYIFMKLSNLNKNLEDGLGVDDGGLER